MFLDKPTSIEIKMLEELRRRNIKFIYQYWVFGRFVVDFAFPKSRLIVECDSDYWHANPKKYALEKLNCIQKRNATFDRKMQGIIEIDGWKAMRFWEE